MGRCQTSHSFSSPHKSCEWDRMVPTELSLGLSCAILELSLAPKPAAMGQRLQTWLVALGTVTAPHSKSLFSRHPMGTAGRPKHGWEGKAGAPRDIHSNFQNQSNFICGLEEFKLWIFIKKLFKCHFFIIIFMWVAEKGMYKNWNEISAWLSCETDLLSQHLSYWSQSSKVALLPQAQSLTHRCAGTMRAGMHRLFPSVWLQPSLLHPRNCAWLHSGLFAHFSGEEPI